jgi:peroxiredoxin
MADPSAVASSPGGARTAWTALALALAALLVAAGIGAAIGLRPQPVAGRGGPQAPPAALTPGRRAPALSGTTIDGSRASLAAESGRVVLVNFFASWCAECAAEIPDIQAAYARDHARGFDVIGVDVLDGGDGAGFFRGRHATYPALIDSGRLGGPGPVARAWGMTSALPVSVFLDRQGRIAQVYLGRIDAATIASELRAMGLS